MWNVPPQMSLAASCLSALLAISTTGYASDGDASADKCSGDGAVIAAGTTASVPCAFPELGASQRTGQTSDVQSLVIGDCGHVELSGQRLTVDLDNAPLPQVLRGIATLARFRVEPGQRSKEVTISERFRDLPLDEGLQRLLRHVNQVIIRAEATEGPGIAKVIVLGVKPGYETVEVRSRPPAPDAPSPAAVPEFDGFGFPDGIEQSAILEQLRHQMVAAGNEIPLMAPQAEEMIRRIEQEAEHALLGAGLPSDIVRQIAPYLKKRQSSDVLATQPSLP